MTVTYDPIREIVELRRVRMKAPLEPPAMGTALVLERAAGEPLVVWPGDKVPEARFGNYRRLYRVDVGNRGVSITVTAPSRDPAFPFTVTVAVGSQIIDPVVVVRDGVRDMAAALQPSLTGIVRAVAAHFDLAESTAAEAAIIARLNAAYPLSSVRLTGFAVTVDVVDTSGVLTATREVKVHEIRLNAMRPVVEGGRDELLAHSMAINNGDPTPFLDAEQEERENATQASLQALAMLMGSSKGLEEFITSRISEQAVNRFFPGAGAAIPSRRGVRERLERKTRGSIESGPVIEESVSARPGEPARGTTAKPTDPAGGDVPGKPDSSGDAASGGPDGAGRRASRIRGTARPATPPSDDR
jgi:hypothetical protein